MIRGRMVYGIYLAKYAVAEVKTLKARCMLSGIRVTQHQLIAYAIKQGMENINEVLEIVKQMGYSSVLKAFMTTPELRAALKVASIKYEVPEYIIASACIYYLVQKEDVESICKNSLLM